jgi:hypothetical protein
MEKVTAYLLKVGARLFRARRIAILRSAQIDTELSRWARHIPATSDMHQHIGMHTFVWHLIVYHLINMLSFICPPGTSESAKQFPSRKGFAG